MPVIFGNNLRNVYKQGGLSAICECLKIIYKDYSLGKALLKCCEYEYSKKSGKCDKLLV